MKRDYRNAASTAAYRALSADLSALPISFVYNGTQYTGLSAEFAKETDRQCQTFPDSETQSVCFSFLDCLDITVVFTHYFSHGATEWTVWFENKTERNSGILTDVKTEFSLDGAYPTLKGILGDYVNQYAPYCIDLQHQTVNFSSDSGRATHIDFPYFNLEYGNCGLMFAIGWAGTWRARFSSDGNRTTVTASSVNGLKTYLKPGERIRTALFVVAPYTVRNEAYATNYWRDWFVRHNLPKADATGAALQPFSTCCLASDTGLPNSDGSISECSATWRPSLEKMIAEDARVDFRWFDAGWYVAPDGTSAIPYQKGHDWWDTVGTWELDPAKWQGNAFAESVEFAHRNGIRTLVWFEPERVTDPENLAKHYGYKTEWAIRREGDRAISNNIGDPECLKWTTDRICKMLRENKIDMYREDNNCNAAGLWKYMDETEGADRCGITESKFIMGHYQMWDDIIACTRSYGGCGFVDSCASGGGRNDLESMRRGVPLLRSDSDRTTTALRLSMSASFNKWIPFSGAATREQTEQQAKKGLSDPYTWRASYLAALNVTSQFVYEPEENFEILRFGLREWKRVSPYLLKEFYCLTPWHKEQDHTDFTAFCYYDAEREEGVILAFRQEKCKRGDLELALPFAEPGETYTLTDEDSRQAETIADRFSLNFPAPRTAKLLWIEKV